ncbi:MAG: hypothetical protein JJE17_12875, partial [Peptostreptococcaceae bacterium]|nr:hypothetical protein [Peptostreptococcaceae bacterium]
MTDDNLDIEKAENETPEALEVSPLDEPEEARWYVVHTYSGHENKVKVNIEKIVENRGMQDLVLSIIVPT